MNKNITSFYVINKDNITIVFESNLKYLISRFNKVEPNSRNYMYYYRKFKKNPVFDEGVYTFQQLV